MRRGGIKRPWLPSEDARLRETIADACRPVARELGRSVTAVNQRRRRLGLCAPHPGKLTAAELDRLRELNGQEYTDAEIAQVLGRERHSVGRERARLGLPCRHMSPRRRARTAAATANQLERQGLESLAQLRELSRRLKAVRRGWPAECTPLMCDVLDLLASEPRTKRELCSLLGRPWHRCKALVTNGSASVLWLMVGMGLVVRMGRRQFDVGKGRTEWVYGLAPGVECRRPALLAAKREAAA